MFILAVRSVPGFFTETCYAMSAGGYGNEMKEKATCAGRKLWNTAVGIFNERVCHRVSEDRERSSRMCPRDAVCGPQLFARIDLLQQQQHTPIRTFVTPGTHRHSQALTHLRCPGGETPGGPWRGHPNAMPPRSRSERPKGKRAASAAGNGGS